MSTKIAPNRSITFEEKKQSITHLFETISGLRLGCEFILAKRSEKTANYTLQNQRHFECEIPRELFQFNSIQFKNFNHPTRGNFVVVMAGS